MNKEEIKIITLGDIFSNLETEEQAFEFLKYIKNLQQENKQLKDNWNKLKEFIAKEYYMYLPLDAGTKSITILTNKMQELEGSGINDSN